MNRCYDHEMSENALVFVSCGQVTDAEKKLGRDLIALVERVPGLQAYFAETVSSLEGLTTNIFKNLERASAFVTVMHHRGLVKGRSGADRIRASVWIEQEIAIASFLRHTRSPNLQVAAYAQRGIAREGVRDKLLLNAVEFGTEDEILADLASKLTRWDLRPRRSDVANVDVRLSRKDREIHAERHVYGLQMSLTNTSSVSIPEIEYELEFPSAFVPPNRQFHAREERADQATATHRAFRGSQKVELRPGKETTIGIFEYQMTDELRRQYRDKMEHLLVTAQVFAEGRLIGSATTPFQQLQIF
jgi:hypothetical protein